MRDSAIRLDQNRWVKSDENGKLDLELIPYSTAKLKSRLGFIYFLILASMLILLFIN